MSKTILIALVLIGLLASSCARPSTPVSNQPNSTPGTTRKAATPQIQVTSTAFKEGEAIPRQFTCQGINISPPLEWTPTPQAKTIAIIANDPDAPAGEWTHWLVYNLPAATMGLIENMPAEEKVAGGAMQGKNDFGKTAYGGPCPPKGTHRYFFKVYALDTELALKPGATKDQLLQAMEGHILAQGQLMGTFAK
jgi:Raf kinase inhibitor-like YbhB/YbcL family protein